MNKVFTYLKKIPVWGYGVLGTYVTNYCVELITSFNPISYLWKQFQEFLKFKFEVTVWHIAISLLTLALLILIIKKAITYIKPKFYDFTSMEYMKILWCWKYKKTKSGYSIDHDSIMAMCPECKRLLTIEKNGYWDSDGGLTYKCAKCKEVYLETDSDFSDPNPEVIREIDMRIRNEDFK